MKISARIYSGVLYLLFSNPVFSQITISQNEFQPYMSVGTSAKMYVDTSTKFVNIGQKGGGNIYDFSNLPFFLHQESPFLDVSSVPKLASRYAVGNISYKMEFGDNTSYFIFSFDNQEWSSVGNAEMDSVRENYDHTSPYQTSCKFPVTYNGTFSTTSVHLDSTYENGVLDTAETKTITMSGIVDGYGTLKLPGNVNLECLRLVKWETAPYTHKEFNYLTKEGITLFVNTRTDQADTGIVEKKEIIGYFKSNASPVSINFNKIQNAHSLQVNAFPNPFSGTTGIKYSIPSDAQVKIKVFNILGEELETLLDKYLQAGTYQTDWIARGMQPGIYYLQFTANNKVLTKKILLNE